MNWINSKLINKSEIARLMGISRTGLHNKINKINGNFFNESDKEKLEVISLDLMKEIIGVGIFEDILKEYLK